MAMSKLPRQQIQTVFELIDREVWIVTASAGDRRGGLVATWVTQASIDPENPVVVVGIAKNHFTAEIIGESGSFVLHLLAEAHLDHVWRFGLTSGRSGDKFKDLEVIETAAGPRLQRCLAWLRCRVVDPYDGGDRIYFWGDVVDGGQVASGRPLREHDVMAAATPEQLAALRASREADIVAQRPLVAAWRATRMNS